MAARTISLSSSQLRAESDEHPNEMKFKGVLVKLDVPSDRPPNGAEGHRILLPKEVAQKHLKTLIGMGLNYDPDLDAHAPRRKVGVVQKAYITGSDLWVEGVIWKHDFPEAKKDLHREGLGMSMEVNQVQIKDADAPVWEITDLCFLGGTILKKNAAAYHDTRAIAAARADSERRIMSIKKQTAKPGSNGSQGIVDIGKVARIAAKEVAAASAESTEQILAVLNAQTPILASLAASLETLTLGAGAVKADAAEPLTSVKAKGVAAKSKDDEDCDDDEDDDDDDEEMDSASDAEGDLEKMGPEDEEGKPGHLNKDAPDNKGSSAPLDDKVGKTVSSAREKVLRQKVQSLAGELEANRVETAELKKQLTRLGKQVQAAASETDRRSATLPADIAILLSKANVDGRELMASGSKLTVDQSDGVLAAFEAATNVKLDTVKRIQFKNQLMEAGLLEDGQMRRYLS